MVTRPTAPKSVEATSTFINNNKSTFFWAWSQTRRGQRSVAEVEKEKKRRATRLKVQFSHDGQTRTAFVSNCGYMPFRRWFVKNAGIVLRSDSWEAYWLGGYVMTSRRHIEKPLKLISRNFLLSLYSTISRTECWPIFHFTRKQSQVKKKNH